MPMKWGSGYSPTPGCGDDSSKRTRSDGVEATEGGGDGSWDGYLAYRSADLRYDRLIDIHFHNLMYIQKRI